MRKCVIVLLTFALTLCLCMGVFAAMPPVLDQSRLLTEQENSDLNTYFGQIREEAGYAVCVVTTDSFDGKTAKSYAEDYFDTYFGGDGALLVVSLEEGYWYISTNGSCARNISDSQVDAIGEAVVNRIRQGEYYEAFYDFGGMIRSRMSAPPEEGSGITAMKIVVCLVIGLAAGGITVGVMASGMKSVRSQANAGSYMRRDSLQVTASHDIYLYNTVTRVPRPKSNSSSGGSRSRGGSGGRI